MGDSHGIKLSGGHILHAEEERRGGGEGVLHTSIVCLSVPIFADAEPVVWVMGLRQNVLHPALLLHRGFAGVNILVQFAFLVREKLLTAPALIQRNACSVHSHSERIVSCRPALCIKYYAAEPVVQP